jgi:predicted permease
VGRYRRGGGQDGGVDGGQDGGVDGPGGRSRLDDRLRDEIRDEIGFYLEERARELEAEGMDADEARRRAEAAFGDRTRIEREALREHVERTNAWRGWMGNRLRDVRFAARGLARSPGFTVAVLVTLALGIGANTAIFSVAEGVFLRPPPVRDPDGLVAVYTTCRAGDPRCSSSYPDYLDYLELADGLSDLAARSSTSLSVGEAGSPPNRLTAYLVTGNYFALLGVAPAAGRLLDPVDHDVEAPAPVAVLAWHAWRDFFGGDPAVVGRSVRMNGVSVEVVGVAPEGFRGTSLTGDPDLFLPMATGQLVDGFGTDRFDNRGTRWMDVLVGRMAPGTTADALQEEMRAVATGLNEAYPEDRGERSITVDPLQRYALPQFARDDLTRLMTILGGVVGLSLLLACANLANLLLARATARRREIGVRFALGAGRGGVLAQLLTESLVLAGAGGLAGLAVAAGLLRLMARYSLPGGVSLDHIGVALDGRVLLFTLGLAGATALAFGLVPALVAIRTDVQGALRGEVGTATRGEGRLRKGLVAAQVALCLVLLVGSGLFLRALRNGLTQDLGFQASGLALARFDLGGLGYSPDEAVELLERMRSRVGALPGVTSASYGSQVPFQVGGSTATLAEVDGYQPAADEEIRVEFVVGGPGFLESLGLRLDQGVDALSATAPEGTILVNRTMADRYWAGAAPGGAMVLGQTRVVVAGVVHDQRWRDVAEPAANHALLPATVAPGLLAGQPVTFAARTSGEAPDLLPALRRELLALEPDLTFFYLQTAEDLVGAALAPQSLGALLFSAFAVLALVLAGLGIGGVVAYTVARSRRSIGLRIALGASGGRVMLHAVAGLAPPVVTGLAAGAGVALLLSDTVAAFLVEVPPRDPGTYVAVAVLLAAVAAVAALVPARLAARIDPMEALKDD